MHSTLHGARKQGAQILWSPSPASHALLPHLGPLDTGLEEELLLANNEPAVKIGGVGGKFLAVFASVCWIINGAVTIVAAMKREARACIDANIK